MPETIRARVQAARNMQSVFFEKQKTPDHRHERAEFKKRGDVPDKTEAKRRITQDGCNAGNESSQSKFAAIRQEFFT